MFIGLIIIFILKKIDQKNLFKFFNFCFLFVINIVNLSSNIGIEVKGSKRWLDLYLLPRLQPIELLKPFFIIALSLILSSEKISNL